MANKIPLEYPRFDGSDYDFWKKNMEGYLSAHGYEIEKAYQNAYTPPPNGPSTSSKIKAHEINAKKRFIIVNSLLEIELVKVMSLKTTKEVNLG